MKESTEGRGSSRINPIAKPTPELSGHRRWDCVHQCPQCGHIINLGDLDLKAATSGIAACLNCTWTGQIEIQIVERPQSAPETSTKEKNADRRLRDRTGGLYRSGHNRE